MPESDLIQLFAQPLNDVGIRYLVSGSVASTLYGEPRVTHDIDFVVFLRPADIPKLSRVYPAPEFYVPGADIIATEVAPESRGHFNVLHADSGLKADFYISRRPARLGPSSRQALYCGRDRNQSGPAGVRHPLF
jgi:hypothetical protein